jgi:dCTP deaminase
MSEFEQTGVYSNRQIIEALETGHIVQYPSAPELINGSSVDVRLGYNFYVTDQSTQKEGLYNPYDEEDVRRYFGEPLVAKPLREHDTVRRRLGLESLKGIDPDHPIIILRPGERILGHTHEFIGIKAPGTTSMQAKSTTGRNGITVCKDAGWGDPGYINRWTMEIQNENEDEYVPVPVGLPIAQLVFLHTGKVNGDYTNLSGNYQTSMDIDELIANWTPDQMLPKTFRRPIEKSHYPVDVEGLAEGVK